jgi:hypothetical protein
LAAKPETKGRTLAEGEYKRLEEDTRLARPLHDTARWSRNSIFTMACLLLLGTLLLPRVALALMWLLTTYLQRAFHNSLVSLVLGFIFLPLTTIVYAWEINNGLPLSEINLLWLLIAVIIDLGGFGSSMHRRSKI